MKTKYQAVRVRYKAGIYLAVTDGTGRFTVFDSIKRKWTLPLTAKDAVLIGHASADQITRERASLSEGMAVLTAP